MNAWALAASRLATATRSAFSATRIAFQFLRAMFAEPRMPHLQMSAIGISNAREVTSRNIQPRELPPPKGSAMFAQFVALAAITLVAAVAIAAEDPSPV